MFKRLRALVAFGRSDGVAGSATHPSWNAWTRLVRYDLPDAIVYTLSLPDFHMMDIGVEVHDRRVVVRGDHGKGHLNAGPRRSFVRIFNLPEALNERDVRAELRDGVFSLTIAKKRGARGREIPNEVVS
jgi:HSP20 family molecular chaperone IbpA